MDNETQHPETAYEALVNENDEQVEKLEQWGYPPVLIKACFDPFHYAMRLTTGEAFVFHEARASNERWVHIAGIEREDQTAWTLDRGIDIRVDQIVWIADAPLGSRSMIHESTMPPEKTMSNEPRIHELKCWPSSFQPIQDGRKTFEFRKNDRDYQVGDVLELREWDPHVGAYTASHRLLYRRVEFILKGEFGVPDGYCVLAIKPCDAEGRVGVDDAAGALRKFYAANACAVDLINHIKRSANIADHEIWPAYQNELRKIDLES